MVTTLPEGVRLLSVEESNALPNPWMLPYSRLFRHPAVVLRDEFKCPLVQAIDEEFVRACALYREDFSSGTAVYVLKNGLTEYEPSDYMAKVSAHMVAFQNTLPDEYFNANGMGGRSETGYSCFLASNLLTQHIHETSVNMYIEDLSTKILRGRYVHRHKGIPRKGRQRTPAPWFAGGKVLRTVNPLNSTIAS